MPQHTNVKEAEVEWFYEDLQDLLELTPKKKVLFIISSVQFSHSVVSDSLRPHRLQHARPPCPSPTPRVYSNWNAKVGSQEIPGVTGKFGLEVQTEAGQRLTVLSEYTGHGKHPIPTTQETTLHMDITR